MRNQESLHTIDQIQKERCEAAKRPTSNQNGAKQQQNEKFSLSSEDLYPVVIQTPLVNIITTKKKNTQPLSNPKTVNQTIELFDRASDSRNEKNYSQASYINLCRQRTNRGTQVETYQQLSPKFVQLVPNDRSVQFGVQTLRLTNSSLDNNKNERLVSNENDKCVSTTIVPIALKQVHKPCNLKEVSDQVNVEELVNLDTKRKELSPTDEVDELKTQNNSSVCDKANEAQAMPNWVKRRVQDRNQKRRLHITQTQMMQRQQQVMKYRMDREISITKRDVVNDLLKQSQTRINPKQSARLRYEFQVLLQDKKQDQQVPKNQLMFKPDFTTLQLFPQLITENRVTNLDNLSLQPASPKKDQNFFISSSQQRIMPKQEDFAKYLLQYEQPVQVKPVFRKTSFQFGKAAMDLVAYERSLFPESLCSNR